jgi:hypothetical protein
MEFRQDILKCYKIYKNLSPLDIKSSDNFFIWKKYLSI